MDDFNDGTTNNLFGGGEGDLDGGSAPSFSSAFAIGNAGFSRQIPFDAGAQASDGYFSARNSVDLSSFSYVSFWIKGQSGGEKVHCYVDDNVHFPAANVWTFLPDRVTTDFQKVVISTKAFYSSAVDWGATGGAFKIEGSNTIPSGVGSVYIDDIRFGTKAAPVWWDNFNDGAAPFNYGLDYETFVNPAGSLLTPSYDNTLFYGTTGYSYRIDFAQNSNTTDSVILLPSTNQGMDVSGTDTLSFQIRSDAAGSGNNLGIGLKDVPGTESVLDLTSYLSGGLSSSGFKEVRIPLSAFTTNVSALDLTQVRSVELWFQKSASPALTQSSTFTVYLDNLQFVDASTPTPRGLTSNGSGVGNGGVFVPTNTVEIAMSSSDATLEEAGFEYSTDGTTWIRVFTATDTSTGVSSFTWLTSGLAAGQYQVRAYAEDVQGNFGFLGPYSVSVLRTTATVTQAGFVSGTLSLPDGDVSGSPTSVTVPDGALAGPVDLSITYVDPRTAPAGQFRGVVPASVYSFGPEGLRFQKAATIALKYSDDNFDGTVDGTFYSASQLRMFWYDGLAWRPVQGRLNSQNHTVSGPVFHFSLYALYPVTSEPLDTRPKEKVITPNGDGVNDAAYFDNLPDGVTIKIFDLSGRLVRTLNGLAYWDGRDDGGQIVPNGAYIYQYRVNFEEVTGAIGVAR